MKLLLLYTIPLKVACIFLLKHYAQYIDTGCKKVSQICIHVCLTIFKKKQQNISFYNGDVVS